MSLEAAHQMELGTKRWQTADWVKMTQIQISNSQEARPIGPKQCRIPSFRDISIRLKKKTQLVACLIWWSKRDETWGLHGGVLIPIAHGGTHFYYLQFLPSRIILGSFKEWNWFHSDYTILLSEMHPSPCLSAVLLVPSSVSPLPSFLFPHQSAFWKTILCRDHITSQRNFYAYLMRPYRLSTYWVLSSFT